MGRALPGRGLHFMGWLGEKGKNFAWPLALSCSADISYSCAELESHSAGGADPLTH
jgi:hypothetical protein